MKINQGARTRKKRFFFFKILDSKENIYQYKKNTTKNEFDFVSFNKKSLPQIRAVISCGVSCCRNRFT